MITVKLDGKVLPTEAAKATTMADLIEYVKASIDPDTIITAIALEGENLSDVDWRMPLVAHASKCLELSTGTKEEYLSSRFPLAPDLLDCISEEFVQAGKHFSEGETDDGNTRFAKAVNDFSAFITWYNSLLEMLQGTGWEDKINFFSSQINELNSTCEQLLQEQLYHSWWALSETINNTLQPQINTLKAECVKLAESWK